MPRNAVAIWFKAVFMIASIPPLFGWTPLPMALQNASEWQVRAILILIIAGCFVSLVGIFWRNRLDGGAIEQFGLIILIVGIVLFVVALLNAVPTSWFGAIVYSGLAVAFGIQWWLIHRYRRSLLTPEGSDG